MSEVRTIRLTKSGDFNGATPIPLTRDDFTVSGQRNYSALLAGPAGVIDASFFGLFSPDSAKAVGVAFSSANPRSVVAILDPSGRPREQVNLRPYFQYILLHPGERLGVLSSESTPAEAVTVELTLAVNELSEAQHLQWALTRPPLDCHTRLRIVRRGDFIPSFGAPLFVPAFTWNPGNNVLEANDSDNQGPIPIAALSPFARQYGSLLSIRYSNSNNDGKVFLVEHHTRARYQAQDALPSCCWSRVQYAAHDDLIALAATASPAGGELIVDIEVIRVEPGDRLRGRFAEAEFTGGFNL